MVNKTKSFPKLTPTSYHKPVCLSEIQTKYYCLHYMGSLGCLPKKEFTKFVKELFSFTNMYVHIKIRLQMKKNFFILFLRRHLRAGYITEVEGQIQPTSLS